MGLDITARIRKVAAIEIENAYIAENWPKVESGAMTETEYCKGYPNDEHSSIDLTEYSIRNFWGLRKYFIETLGLPDNTVFHINSEDLTFLIDAADNYTIPHLDDENNYFRKCDELLAVCRRARSECNFNEEVVEFFFCS